ncbi:MAG: hypothetical protein AB1778_03450 [Candidatus Bipolaricaulota bacterium]
MAPREALVYWIGTSENEIHFIDAVLTAYDGLASVRRELRVADGIAMYKVYVASGMEDEFLEVVARLRDRAKIQTIRRGEPDEVSASA